jgi:hypothetical protein
VRFTGSSIAGLAFVAATGTLSVLQIQAAWACTTKKRRLSNVGVDLSSDTHRYPVCGRRRPL